MSHYTNMTDDDLRSKARVYDRTVNEGGEGYNPYTDELERREMVREAARPKTRDERIADLYDEIERNRGTADGWISHEEIKVKVAPLYAEIEALKAAAKAEFAREWTLDVTKARRAEWNARARAGEFNRADGRTDWAKVEAAEKAYGWSTGDLKSAIQMYNL